MADRADAGTRSPPGPARMPIDRCRFGALSGRRDAPAKHHQHRGRRRGHHLGKRSPATSVAPNQRTRPRWTTRHARRVHPAPFRRSTGLSSAATHPPGVSYVSRFRRPDQNAELRSSAASRPGHGGGSPPPRGSTANPARPTVMTTTVMTTTATTRMTGMRTWAGMTGREMTRGRRSQSGPPVAAGRPTNGFGRRLSTGRRAARSPNAARGDAGIRRARSRHPVARRRHQAGGERRNPRSRYEVATGGDSGRDGAPGVHSIIEPGVSTPAARASRQCAIIARAVDSGSSICGTCPQPASTSSLEVG